MRPRYAALIVAFAILIAAFVLTRGTKSNRILVATAGPATGQLASLGEQMLAGARMAVDDINRQGGVLDQKIELVIGDDQCDPKQAVAVANQLASQGVVFVAGHFCSSSSIPASTIYEDEQVIMISPASTSPLLTKINNQYIFRVCGRDDQQGDVIGRHLVKNFPDKNIAIVHDKSAYGKGLASEVIRTMRAGGKEEQLFEAITAGEKDYSALVTKLKQNRIDVLFVGGYHTEAGLILRQMRNQSLQTVLMAGDSLVTKEFWSIAGAEGDGTLFSFAPDPRKIASAGSILKRFRQQNIEPEGYILYTYAAFQAWAQAAEKAGKIDNGLIAEILKKEQFDTVLGQVRFDGKGDVNLPPYAIYEWRDGSYDQLSTF